MFNSIASLFVSCLFFLSCNNEAKTESTKQDSNVTVSSDTVPTTKPAANADEHGCKTDAGETWSIVRNSCVRLTESGIKLDPQDPALDKTKAAYIVFSDDKIRVEIFLPTQKKPVIIRKSSGEGELPKWANGPLTLSLSNDMYTLDDEGKILYSGSAPK